MQNALKQTPPLLKTCFIKGSGYTSLKVGPHASHQSLPTKKKKTFLAKRRSFVGDPERDEPPAEWLKGSLLTSLTAAPDWDAKS